MNENELLDTVIDAGLSKEYNAEMRKIAAKLAREVLKLDIDNITSEKIAELKEHAKEIFPATIKAAKFSISIDVD
tara:strand:- start:967 stop:1191 length:225 start_codon:yes stop_codon:yes gene_type:complete